MVLGYLPVPGRPTIWITVGQGPTALAECADGALFGHFYSHLSFLSSFSLSLGDGPIYIEILFQRVVKPKTTNQPTVSFVEKVIVAVIVCPCLVSLHLIKLRS